MSTGLRDVLWTSFTRSAMGRASIARSFAASGPEYAVGRLAMRDARSSCFLLLHPVNLAKQATTNGNILINLTSRVYAGSNQRGRPL